MRSPARPKSLVLAMDIGSSSVRAAFFGENGKRILPTTAARSYSIHYSDAGGAELAPNELLGAAKQCLGQTLRARERIPALRKIPVVAIGASAFWHGLLGLDRKGKPSTPIFTWADSRSAPDAAALREKLSEREFQLRTGCMLRAPYWPAKLHWLRRPNRALFRRTGQWISPASWIFAKLFGTEITSHSMASGTGLYNLENASWDEELCELCHIRVEQLGRLHERGLTSNRAPRGLRGTDLFSAIGDGAASNLGSGAVGSGRIAINIGTSAAARMILPKRDKTRLPFGLFKYVVDAKRVVIGGAISNGGNLRQWCLRELQLGGEKETARALDREAAASNPLTVLPFWVSERAPTWPEELRGTITGLMSTTNAADIFSAITTSTFYRLAQIVDQLSSRASTEIIVSGGILHSSAGLQILADSLGRNLRISSELESSLRGAAFYALENLGHELKQVSADEIVRHRPVLADKHRSRRERQIALERALTPPRAVPRSRPVAK